VFQNYALYPHMTVRENMSFSLKLAATEPSAIAAQVARAAAILGLEDLLDRYPRQLSGGQRQRVAMGRAIVRNPQVFLFDEPLSNLDARLRVQMRTEIRELHQRLQTTSIYVTHDQIEAMTMADRIVVMRDGRVEQIGAPLDLYNRPVNTFVAGFIGSPAMNLVPATVRASAAGRWLQFGDGAALPAPDFDPDGAPLAQHLVDGQAVLFGFRPEHCGVGASGLQAAVRVVEPTGADTQLYCRFNDHEVTATIRDHAGYRPGDAIVLVPDIARSHLFDAAGGQRIAA
jgi:multiple sugar transport system ATP-binding protein